MHILGKKSIIVCSCHIEIIIYSFIYPVVIRGGQLFSPGPPPWKAIFITAYHFHLLLPFCALQDRRIINFPDGGQELLSLPDMGYI